jgi:hypothetical protein
MTRRTIAGLAGLGLAGIGFYAARRSLVARALGLRSPEHSVHVERDIPIAMPDGVVLYADRYSPKAPGLFPTILVRSPYGRAGENGPLRALTDAAYELFAERGYNVLVQGVRGRYRSGGSFDPFVHEAADGRATLEWIADQPWFEGNLGMWGASYLGYTQWAVAADAPPYLKALVPLVTTTRFSRSFYPEGSFAFESSLRWAHITDAMVGAGGTLDWEALRKISARARAAALDPAFRHLPISEADAVATGKPVEFYRRWFDDPNPEGPYWRKVDHHRALGKVNAAVHLVAGWYDIFLNGQLADYAALLAAGRTPYLTVLPRAHMDTMLQIEAVREGLWWFDAHLKGQRELLQQRRPVRLALMSSGEWHEMDFWPPPAQISRRYLHAAGLLSTGAPAELSPADHYTYDSRDPTPSLGGPVLSEMAGPRDQRPIEARRDVLTYTSSPLAHDIDVIGPVRLELFVRSSQPHTDFVGRLSDVSPDGSSINVCEGLFRVAPGHGEQQPDGSLRIEIDMWSTARRFARGHRMRLVVCSAAHPRWAANHGDGAPLGRSGPGQPVEQTILHDAAHPSALMLPIVNTEVRERMASAERPGAAQQAKFITQR